MLGDSDVCRALERLARERPQDVAFSTATERLDYMALARRVAGAAARMASMPNRIGLLGISSLDWVVADLAAWLAGKCLVPLPHFFSDGQFRHILIDANLDVVLSTPDQVPRLAALGIGSRAIPQEGADWPAEARMAGERIVYTSGSTGAPKGVRLGAAQIRHSAGAMLQALRATPEDRHLSVMPFSLLLEAISGIYLPILAGGECRIAPEVIAAQGVEIATCLGEAAENFMPTTTVLVPQLLQGWVIAASIGRVSVPSSLRFVAVGGAAVPDSIAERAWSLGIPVHEGYGLTECGSVVAVNLPGERRAGSVGRPLPGYAVEIAPDGEILVRSASVCMGYQGRKDALREPGLWHTGDVGRMDGEGYLFVLGRKDNLIVAGNGRNIHPEWIETMVLADPRVARAVLSLSPGGKLALVLEPSILGAAWFAKSAPEARRKWLNALLDEAPGYARPGIFLVLPPDGFSALDLLTANGRPRRTAVAAHLASQKQSREELSDAVL